jgi:hypothetical protein
LKTIALLPIRNEAAMLPYSLDCLSKCCDVVLVYDQDSEDTSRDICRQFPRVQLIESKTAAVCEVGRWRLLDAARDYEGENFLWCTDADELISPAQFRRFLAREQARLEPGTVVEGMFYHLWGRTDRYRDDGSPYAPYWKAFGLVDDRKADFDRSPALPLHQSRVPLRERQSVIQSDLLHVLHLQWLKFRENQLKQAWYRCSELLDGRQPSEINARYSITLPPSRVRTSSVPEEWVEGVTFPDTREEGVTWQERDVIQWLEEFGPQRFEPLEIWHIRELDKVFRARVGRRPRPDRSYRPPLAKRARRFARRIMSGTRRRLFP